MKNLKLLVLPLLIFGALLSSCSSDDDKGVDEEYQIVGTWKVSDIKQNGLSIYAMLQMVAPCPLENIYIFASDHSIKIETFEEGIVSQNCVEGEVQFGTWSKEGSTYSASFLGETTQSEVTFINNNNFTANVEFEGEEVEVKMTRH